jgi:hypothetical protein
MGKNIFLIFLFAAFITTSCTGEHIPGNPSEISPITDTPTPISTSTQIPVYPPFTDTPIPPTYTPTQTPTANLSPTMTPTFDYVKYVDSWSTYTNENFGFSFDYPTIYDVSPYSSCRVHVNTSEPWIFYLDLGYRSELAIANNDLSSFSDYVDRWVQSIKNREDWSLWSRYGRVINSYQAATIEYNFSIRYGTTTFFGKNHNIYIFNWTAGSGCDIPEIRLYEYDAYNHAVETFKFITPHP